VSAPETAEKAIVTPGTPVPLAVVTRPEALKLLGEHDVAKVMLSLTAFDWFPVLFLTLK
jgi:hypothetical protein